MSVDDVIPAHGGQLRELAARFGIHAENLLDFSVNVNPEGTPDGVRDALRAALDDPAVLTQYPDLEEQRLRQSIAAYASVEVASVAVGNGFVPLLDAALQSLRVRRCLVPVPAFSEYAAAMERAGVVAMPFVLDREHGFRNGAGEILDAAVAGNCDTILLANPMTPSGVLCDRQVLSEIVAKAAERDIRVLLDEAFIDYEPARSMVSEAKVRTGFVVFRSVTKFHGMAGMRVAYAVAAGDVAKEMRSHVAPWAITTLAAIAVQVALADVAYAERTIRLNAERRARLAGDLREMGIGVYDSAANFLLMRFPVAVMTDALWARLLREEGIVLRHCGNFEGIGHDHLRCAVRNEQDNARLIGALRRRL